jgi:hypothetical protein
MAAVISFFMAHQEAFATIAGILLQEFVRKAKFIDGNTLGEAAYNYAYNFLKSRSKPLESAPEGK